MSKADAFRSSIGDHRNRERPGRFDLADGTRARSSTPNRYTDVRLTGSTRVNGSGTSTPPGGGPSVSCRKTFARVGGPKSVASDY